MRLVRIHAGDDGESRFEEVDLPMVAAGERSATALVPAVSTGFGFIEAREPQDWHPAPRRQLVTVLGGALEIECAGGAVRRFGPGDSFIADDLEGRGHVTRYPDGPVRLQYVLLPHDFEFGSPSKAP